MKIMKNFVLCYLITSCQVTRNSTNSLTESVKIPTEQTVTSLQTGKYVGYLSMKNRNDELPFIIEIIPNRSTEKVEKFRGIIKIAHENYTSHEYTSEYFPHIDFYSQNGNIIFKNNENRFTVVDATLQNNIISGALSSSAGIKDGQFYAEYFDESKQKSQKLLENSKPIAHNLTGTYTQTCQNTNQVIQLESFRKNNSQDLQNYDWALTGRIGNIQNNKCFQDLKTCKQAEFTNVKYDFFSGTLNLEGPRFFDTCKVTDIGLQCDSCNYVKSNINYLAFAPNAEKLTIYPRKNQLVLSSDEANPDVQEFNSAEGTFYGYIHHQKIDRYQLMRLQINGQEAKNKKGEVWQFLSGHASLFFGKDRFDEFIVHEFQPRRYVKERPYFTFDGNGEIFITIDRWSKKSLSGTVYSKNYGIIGTVDLVANRIPAITKDMAIIPGINGEYENETSKIYLHANSGKSSSPRDYYPMEVFGWAIDKRSGSHKKSVIVKGTYDFYTGIASLKLDDHRQIFGKINQETSQFFWPLETSDSNNLMSQTAMQIRRIFDTNVGNPIDVLSDIMLEKAVGRSILPGSKNDEKKNDEIHE